MNPRVRRIAAHEPDTLPLAEYMRQVFWSSGIDLPEDIEDVIRRITLDVIELARRTGRDVARAVAGVHHRV